MSRVAFICVYLTRRIAWYVSGNRIGVRTGVQKVSAAVRCIDDEVNYFWLMPSGFILVSYELAGHACFLMPTMWT
jgi:hypothetical protein